MFNFNLKEAAIYQAIKWSEDPAWRWIKALKKLFFIFSLFSFLIFLLGFTSNFFPPQLNSLFFGSAIIFLTFALAIWLRKAFFNFKQKNPQLKISLREIGENWSEYNLAEFLSFEVAQAVFKSIKFAQRKKISKIDSSILFYFLIVDNPQLNFVFSRALLSLEEIKKTLKEYLKIKGGGFSGQYAESFQRVFLAALAMAQKRNHQRIERGDLLSALAKEDLIFQKFLIYGQLKAEDIENLTCWLERLEKKAEERKRWWEYPNLIRRGTLAKEWTAGYTLTLDRYSLDWSKIARKKGFPEIVGHQKVLEQLERILARREYNNVLLVGRPGVGRRAVIQGLVAKAVSGQSLAEINYKRVVELDMAGLLTGFLHSEEIGRILDKIFQEVVEAGNVILIIPQFHNFIAVSPAPGKIDISGVISSYLHLPQFQVVAITSYLGLHKNIEKNPSILNLFEKVEVPEISPEETITILENLALVLERKYKIFVSYPALKEIVFLAGRFLPALPFPKKALDLLDEVVIYLKKVKGKKMVLPEEVAKIVSEKVQIPVGRVKAREKEILLNLEELIHRRIINQEEAVREVSIALRRARARISSRAGPMGAFLFLGPTGVGKTETSKAVAEVYFGSAERMIRLDMSEFQLLSDIPRLIGSPTEEGLLTTRVREDPFSLILLDEIEKAHLNILNLFLQVLDEGFLTDGLGRRVDFRDSIIIATSNAGYQIILEALREQREWSQVKEKLLDYLFEKGIFRPEFINRFDAVVVFKPLSKENLLDISQLMLQQLKKNLKEKEIELVITRSLKEKIVELGYQPFFGARAMKRVIQDKVENALASALLAGRIKRGDRIEIDPQTFQLKVFN